MLDMSDGMPHPRRRWEMSVRNVEVDVADEVVAEPTPLWAARRTEKISIVMPCLNEEQGIARCIAWAKEGLARTGLPGEIIVADNGSVDRSVAIAEAAGAHVVRQ